MKLPLCEHRHPASDDGGMFLCTHPLVHAPGDLVQAAICKICTQRTVAAAPKATILHPLDLKNGQRPKSVAVVILSHNYGHYLGNAIESALNQTRRADEVVVVDDASTDSTEAVARGFAHRGVTYVRIEARYSQRARRAGWLATRSESIVFLDADDALAPDYLAKGLNEFSDARVGIVYSDVQWFGDARGKSNYPEQFDRAALGQSNYMHTGCLVRRDALAISRALELVNDDRVSLQDWLLWRRVLADGWVARKQRGLYFYRRHSTSLTSSWNDENYNYFLRASLAMETITLFIPLSGRERFWPQTAAFLERQHWPHERIRLVLFDTGQNAEFSHGVRSWLAKCDYPDVRHVSSAVRAPGLADRPRQAAAYDVWLATARIYNRMARDLTTDYVWIVEDDVLPPDDACERLLRGFDPNTASVSGVYRSRSGQEYVVWRKPGEGDRSRGRGLEVAGGNGFGCVVLRGAVLRDTVFTATIDFSGYDVAFYHRLRGTPWRSKVDWSIECEHFLGESR